MEKSIINKAIFLENEFDKKNITYIEMLYEIYKLSPKLDKRTTLKSFGKSMEKQIIASDYLQAIEDTSYYKYITELSKSNI